MKLTCLAVVLFVFSCKFTFAAENIVIQTESSGFFFNIISDATLLLDPDLKKIIANDFDHIVNKSKFNYQGDNWPPRINSKVMISNIYSDINKNNIKESMARLVQPVVEAACTSQRYDPLNDFAPKCIKKLLNYSIITKIEIKYDYKSKKNIDMYTADLIGLNDSNRYQQMVRTVADIMNSAYENISKKAVVKSANLIKNPIPLVQLIGLSSSGAHETSSSISISKCTKPFAPFSNSEVQRYNIEIEEYRHCLDLEKIRAGASPSNIIQERNAKKQAILGQQEIETEQRKARLEEEQQQQAKRDEDNAASGPIVRLPNGAAINTGSGQFLAPNGNGYVGTQDGNFYTPVGSNGLLNTGSGKITPVIR